MPSKRTNRPKRKLYQMHVIALGILCVASSFALGIRTAGDIETVAPSEAQDARLSGDMDGDGRLSGNDAILMLEFAQGYEQPTPEQLLADPNGDGQLTVDDAIMILHELASL